MTMFQENTSQCMFSWTITAVFRREFASSVSAITALFYPSLQCSNSFFTFGRQRR
jgi:hypothetical protein